MLQSIQNFVLLPTPSTLRTRRTSCTNHTDPSEYIPTNSTTIGTSQSTHTPATHVLQPSDTSHPDHVAYSHVPTFLHGILHRARTNNHRSRYRQRWRQSYEGPSPSPPHVPYQPRPSGSNVYELEANEQPSPPWKAWLSQPSPPTSITRPVSPSSETSAPKRQRHDDGTYTPITSSVTSPTSPNSPSAQATPDYQSLPSPRSVGSNQDPNPESPPMLLE